MPRQPMHVLSRRGFLQAAAAATVGAAVLPRLTGSARDTPLRLSLDHAAFGGGAGAAVRRPAIRLGYAAITWGGRDDQAVEDIASLGFRGIQLRASAVERWGARPDDLRRLLEQKGLRLQVLSSGSLDADPAKKAEYLETHLKHARFVKAVGGEYLQVLSRRDEGGTSTAAEYVRLGELLNELGRRTRALGVPLVYHNHLRALSERPEELVKVMDATDPKAVGLLFDIAHYQQGGGDAVKGLLRHKDRVTALHLKDVASPGAGAGQAPLYDYKWVELGRGKVDVKGVMATLRSLEWSGPAIIELDSVTAPALSPRDCAAINKQYALDTLGLSL